MSRAACAKAAIDSALLGKIKQWIELEVGLMAIVTSPDFMSLSDRDQEALLDPVMKADRDAIKALDRLIDSYESAPTEILKVL